MELKVITGMSGAGKSSVLRLLEDLGYFAVDHLPVDLLVFLVDTLLDRGETKGAIAIDIREKGHFDCFFEALPVLKKKGVEVEIIYFEASKETLVRRFRETRRRHPLGADVRILAAIEAEEELLKPLKDKADRCIDTTLLSTPQTQEMISKLYGESTKHKMMVNIVSFGFKHGMPPDADILFDVRFLPNPYYDKELRPFTGLDERISDFVVNSEKGREFRKHLCSMLEFLLNSFEESRRDYVVIGFGCTGGKHRSVAFAEESYKIITDLGWFATISHQDIWRG